MDHILLSSNLTLIRVDFYYNPSKGHESYQRAQAYPTKGHNFIKEQQANTGSLFDNNGSSSLQTLELPKIEL